MASPIKVLIVDDSATVRRMIGMAFTGNGDFTIIGNAANGKEALKRIEELRPDIVVMDVEMPEMDGIQTLAELRKTRSRSELPVVMCSTLTKQGAGTSMQALFKGANDYILKPTGSEGLEQSVQTLRSTLLPKLKQLVHKP